MKQEKLDTCVKQEMNIKLNKWVSVRLKYDTKIKREELLGDFMGCTYGAPYRICRPCVEILVIYLTKCSV